MSLHAEAQVDVSARYMDLQTRSRLTSHSLVGASGRRGEGTYTYRAVDPRVAVHPPHRLGADGLAEDRTQLGALADGVHDLLHDRGRELLLVRHEDHEDRPCAHADGAEGEDRGPLALRRAAEGARWVVCIWKCKCEALFGFEYVFVLYAREGERERRGERRTWRGGRSRGEGRL